jgi:hypothetical protein
MSNSIKGKKKNSYEEIGKMIAKINVLIKKIEGDKIDRLLLEIYVPKTNK